MGEIQYPGYLQIGPAIYAGVRQTIFYLHLINTCTNAPDDPLTFNKITVAVMTPSPLDQNNGSYLLCRLPSFSRSFTLLSVTAAKED